MSIRSFSSRCSILRHENRGSPRARSATRPLRLSMGCWLRQSRLELARRSPDVKIARRVAPVPTEGRPALRHSRRGNSLRGCKRRSA